MNLKWRNWIVATALLTALAAVLTGAGPVWAAEEIVMENDIEYSNPDNQHLQLNMARPNGSGPYPAVVCIHGGGFRAGTRQGYDGLIKKLARERVRRGDGHLPSGAEVPVSRGGLRREGRGPLAARQRGEVQHRSGPHRHDRRLGGRAPRAVPGRDGGPEAVRRRRRQPRPVEPRGVRGQLLRPERLHQVVRQKRRCRRSAAAVSRRQPGASPRSGTSSPARSIG